MAMRLLSLDIATKTGFAVGSLDEGVVEHGVFLIPKSYQHDMGMFGAYWRRALTDIIDRFGPKEIYFEAPNLHGAETNVWTLRKLYGLPMVLALLAFDRSIPLEEINSSEISSHFLGKGYPMKSEHRKKATMAMCLKRGWTVEDDNNADALALLDCAIARKYPNHALQATPLFNQRMAP